MTLGEIYNRLSSARDNIRSALTKKGVNVGTHGFESFASDIESIVTGGGGGSDNFKLIQSVDLGTISTSSTSATNMNRSVTCNDISGYDFVFLVVRRKTTANNYHWFTVSPVAVGGTATRGTAQAVTNIATRINAYYTNATNVASRVGSYGIYANSASLSGKALTCALYSRYSSTYTHTINGEYSADFYGLKVL